MLDPRSNKYTVEFKDGDVQKTQIPDKDVEVVQQVHAARKVCKIEGCWILEYSAAWASRMTLPAACTCCTTKGCWVLMLPKGARSAKRKAPAKGTPGAAAPQGKILECFAGSASAPGSKRRRGEQVKEGASAGAGKASQEETKDGKKRKNEDDTPSEGQDPRTQGS